MYYELRPFVASLISTFDQQFGMELDTGPASKHSSDEQVFSDVSASLGLSHEGVQGVVVIAMEKGFALKLTNLLGGEVEDFKDEIVDDAIGEILNMIVGGAREHSKIKFILSVPICIKALNHQVKPLGLAKYVGVQATSDGGTVDLYLLDLL